MDGRFSRALLPSVNRRHCPLAVYGGAMCGMRRLSDSLRHRRVRVDRPDQFFDRALETQRQRRLGDELGRARTDHVDAEDLVVLLLRDDLDEPLGLVRDARAAENAELQGADANVESALLRLRLREPHAADLRIAIRAAGDLLVVDRPELLARDPLGERDPFRRGEVRELLVARLVEGDHVADRRNARDVRTVLRVHADVAAIEMETGLFDAETVGHRAASGRDEQVFAAQLLRLAVGALGFEIDPVRSRLRAGDLRGGEDLDALLLERPLELRGDGFVLDRYEAREQLDDRDVAAEAAEDGRELDAHRAAPHDDDRLGDRLHVHRFVAGDDALAIELNAGHAARLRARGDDDFLLRAQRLLGAVGDLHAALAGQPARALDPVDLVLLEQELDAVGQPLDDLVLSRLHVVHVEVDRRLAEREAPFLPVLRDLERVRVLEQRLGGDAAPVQARAAEDRRALDHGGLQSELRGPDRGHVAAGTGPDDDDVVLFA